MEEEVGDGRRGGLVRGRRRRRKEGEVKRRAFLLWCV